MYITPPLFRSSPGRSLPGQIMTFHWVPGRGIRRPELTRLVTLESGASITDMGGSGTLLGAEASRSMSMNNIQADQIWTTPLNEIDDVPKGFDRSKTVRFY